MPMVELQDFVSIKEVLVDIHNQIKDLETAYIMAAPKNEIKEKFDALDELVQQEISAEVKSAILADEELKAALDSITSLRRDFGLRLEVEMAEQLLKSADPWVKLSGFHFYPNYVLLAREEGNGAALVPGDKVVFLGSGPLPMSLILLWKLFGIKGIGIEREPERADLSRRLLNRLGLQSEIEILTGDEKLLPALPRYRLLIVAAVAEPKPRVFQYIRQFIPSGALVGYRLYEKGLRCIMYSTPNDWAPAGFREVKRIHPQPPVNNTIIFVEKDDSYHAG